MQISIATIKDQQGAVLPFEFSIPPSEYGPLADDIALLNPVHVQGTVTNTGSSMLVRAQVVAQVELQCSRCLQPVQTTIDAAIEERYRRQPSSRGGSMDEALAEEEDVGYYERDRIDVGEAVRENFALQIPMKPVCDAGCRGLCPQCGVNLNVETCSCRHDDVDPRLAVLREWKAHHSSPE